MIRYERLTRGQLEALIDAHNAAWRTKARVRADAIAAAGAFLEEASIWGEIKPVFMALQHNKCVFCERLLGGALAGSVEQDVEHFRPKRKVRAWPYPGRKPKISYNFATGASWAAGYYWLAYDLENYAAACKPCNTARKANHFPILGSRGAPGADIATLNAAETPLLLFPHGEHGDDPAEYLHFEGILAVPKHAACVQHQRARVTIDFFSLNDREEIRADRFRVIQSLFFALRTSQRDPDPEIRAAAARTIGDMISDAAPQAACARAYLAVAQTNPQQAWDRFNEAERYLKHR